MSDNNLYEPYQSAYRKSHSVETALIPVQNDILQALDKKQCVILVLLDLASALGPILFSVYTLPLGDIMRRHGVKFHLFADDTQIYATFNIPDLQSTCDRTERCISDVQSWMAANFLKLNTEKTEILLISSRFGKVEHTLSSLNIAGATVHSVSSARNIGVIFDSNLCLESHINSICRSAYFHLRNIGAMRKYLNQSATAILVHAFIFSRIDLNNSMLINLPDQLLDKLQRIQNTAARIVTRTSRHEHITPVLANLHWLPVRARIIFKVCVLVYRSLDGNAPVYIRDILPVYQPSRHLRSSENGTLLVVPRVRTTYYGHRAFSVAGPNEWNKLPLYVCNSETEQIFRNKLKTHLYRQFFLK